MNTTREQFSYMADKTHQLSALLLSMKAAADDLDNVDIKGLIDLSLDLLVEPANFLFDQQRAGSHAAVPATVSAGHIDDLERIEKYLEAAMYASTDPESKGLMLELVGTSLDIASNALKADSAAATGA